MAPAPKPPLSKQIGIELSLLVLSALLFALSFPGFHSEIGWAPLAYIALIPLFLVIHSSGWVRIFIYGLFYGFISYSLFNIWLLKFHPLALIIVPIIYAFYFLLFLPALKLTGRVFPRWGWLVQVFLWVGFEFLKARGFLGYSYGVLGYSQYLFLPFIRIASLFGVWGVSFLVVFPSVFIAEILSMAWMTQGIPEVKGRLRRIFYIPALYAVAFVCTLVFGFLTRTDLSDTPEKRFALVQHNVDPWKFDYEDALDILTGLSEKAMESDPDIVVWSETAFVPAIDFHTKYRSNHETYELVKRLKQYMAEQKVPYIIGNDDGQLKRMGGAERIDYNAALLFENGEITDRYWKTHLVPFTEYFPFKKSLPRIYKWLEEADTHFWEKGDSYTVFQTAGMKFSTPICFEDTFGYLSREFVRGGAEVLVNLTNDSWSFSVPAMNQHLAMGVFRAVENRRSMVRSTNGGITCVIDPNGSITAELPAFTENYLVADVPVFTAQTTLYTRWGDWFGWVCLTISFILLLSGSVYALTMKVKYRKISDGDTVGKQN